MAAHNKSPFYAQNWHQPINHYFKIIISQSHIHNITLAFASFSPPLTSPPPPFLNITIAFASFSPPLTSPHLLLPFCSCSPDVKQSNSLFRFDQSRPSEMEAASKRRRTSAGDDATDAEVEEFYAILRRILHATKPRRPARPPPAAWSPSFAPEDFQPRPRNDDGERERGRGRERPQAAEAPRGDGAPAARRGLDLNEAPEPEEVMGSSAG